MKVVEIDDASLTVSDLVRDVRGQSVVLTEHGQPVAMLMDVQAGRHPLAQEEPVEFLKMIEARRKTADLDLIPWNEAKRSLIASPKPRQGTTKKSKSAKKGK